MGEINLRELRETNGMSQEILAQKVGVTRQYIGMLENEVATPSVDVAKKIAKELGFEWTRFYEDNPNVSNE